MSLPSLSPLGAHLLQGGWEALKPMVADSSVSEVRLKFFLGATEWRAGQLQAELEAELRCSVVGCSAWFVAAEATFLPKRELRPTDHHDGPRDW